MKKGKVIGNGLRILCWRRTMYTQPTILWKKKSMNDGLMAEPIAKLICVQPCILVKNGKMELRNSRCHQVGVFLRWMNFYKFILRVLLLVIMLLLPGLQIRLAYNGMIEEICQTQSCVFVFPITDQVCRLRQILKRILKV